VVSVVPDVHLVQLVLVHQLLPLLPGDEGRGVHGSPVADDETVPLAGLGQGEERVLDLNHRPQQVLLELDLSIFREISKVDATSQQDSRSFRDPVDLPAEVLKEGGEPGLASCLASTGAASEDQLPDFSLLLLGLIEFSSWQRILKFSLFASFLSVSLYVLTL